MIPILILDVIMIISIIIIIIKKKNNIRLIAIIILLFVIICNIFFGLKIYENVIISRDMEGQIIYQKEHNLDSVN